MRRWCQCLKWGCKRVLREKEKEMSEAAKVQGKVTVRYGASCGIYYQNPCSVDTGSDSCLRDPAAHLKKKA
jgi:hypothetical protein